MTNCVLLAGCDGRCCNIHPSWNIFPDQGSRNVKAALFCFQFKWCTMRLKQAYLAADQCWVALQRSYNTQNWACMSIAEFHQHFIKLWFSVGFYVIYIMYISISIHVLIWFLLKHWFFCQSSVTFPWFINRRNNLNRIDYTKRQGT